MEPFFCCVNKKLFCTQARFTQDEYNLNKQFIKPSVNAGLQYSNYCRFGDNVWIAPNVSILAAGHPLDMQDRIDGWEYAFPVTVGNNVWIGGSVTIIGGVTIGDNAVIAAGSVVIRDVPADTLVAGNPARVIRKITAEDRKKYQWAEQDQK